MSDYSQQDMLRFFGIGEPLTPGQQAMEAYREACTAGQKSVCNEQYIGFAANALNAQAAQGYTTYGLSGQSGLLKDYVAPTEPVTIKWSAEPLCREDPDWDWWLKLAPEVRAAAVKQFRTSMEADAQPVPQDEAARIWKAVVAAWG